MIRSLGNWLCATAIAAGLVAVVVLWPTPEPSSRPPVDSRPSASAPDVNNLSVGSPDSTDGGHHNEGEWTRQPWRPVAVGFARDFTKPGDDLADWRRRIGRWVSDYLAEQYEHTARHRIPVARLKTLMGPSRARQAVTATAVYDTGLTLALRLEVFPGRGWQVTSATPIDRGRHTGGPGNLTEKELVADG